MSFFAALLASRFGRWLAGALLVIAGIGIALARGFAAGRNAQKLKQSEASLKALRERMRTDEDIAKLDHDARVERLREWVRK